MNHSRNGNPQDVRFVAPLEVTPNPNNLTGVSLINANSGKGIDQLAGDTLGSLVRWRWLAIMNMDKILSWDLESEYIGNLIVPDPTEFRYIT